MAKRQATRHFFTKVNFQRWPRAGDATGGRAQKNMPPTSPCRDFAVSLPPLWNTTRSRCPTGCASYTCRRRRRWSTAATASRPARATRAQAKRAWPTSASTPRSRAPHGAGRGTSSTASKAWGATSTPSPPRKTPSTTPQSCATTSQGPSTCSPTSSSTADTRSRRWRRK